MAILPPTSLTEGNGNQSDPGVNPEPRKHVREERNAFPAAKVGDRHPTKPGPYKAHHGSSSSPLPGAMDHSTLQGLFKRERISRENYSFFLAPDNCAKAGNLQPGALKAREVLR